MTEYYLATDNNVQDKPADAHRIALRLFLKVFFERSQLEGILNLQIG